MAELSDEIVALLGTMPDSALAIRANVSTETIRRARLARGLMADRQTVRWTAEMDTLLGTAADREIAARLGVSREAVTLRRQRLGIGPAHPKRRMTIATPRYLTEDRSLGVVALTSHISAAARLKAESLRLPLLEKYKAAGLPMRDVTVWQVVEHAINELHRQLAPGKKES